MGHAIEAIALNRGHRIVATIDVGNQEDFGSEAFRAADVAIEFTTPATARGNISRTLQAGIPIVVGTTGWHDALAEVEAEVKAQGGGLFYASNFSIGVNIFQAVNRYLARLMDGQPQYDVRMEETHHVHKLDSPSGTALTLAGAVMSGLKRKTAWAETADSPVWLDRGETPLPAVADPSDPTLRITALRRGEVPGIHTLVYESDVDTITLTHSAKSRAGFALGAVVAAEFMVGRKGVHTMEDLLKF